LDVKLQNELKNEKEVLDFLKNLGVNIEKFKEQQSELKISDYLTKTVKKLIFKQALDFKLIDIKKTTTKKAPPAPFITSTLQQEASSKL
jgi:DNA topoisomerase IA